MEIPKCSKYIIPLTHRHNMGGLMRGRCLKRSLSFMKCNDGGARVDYRSLMHHSRLHDPF